MINVVLAVSNLLLDAREILLVLVIDRFLNSAIIGSGVVEECIWRSPNFFVTSDE
jgi:hypothetical protein